MRTILLVLLGGLVAVNPIAPGKAGEVSLLQGHTFGTHYEISLRLENGADERLASIHTDIRGLFDRVDRQMSTWRQDSEINRLSRQPPAEWMPLSASLFEVLVLGQRVAAETNGAFDMTVGELVDLWGFGPGGAVAGVPADSRIEAALTHAGYDRLELDAERRAARRLARFRMDLSGIAKGYAVDEVARYLDDQGVEHYLINIGGDMRARGRPAAERRWLVAVEAPDPNLLGQPYTVIPLSGIAVASSGSYRDFVESDGQRLGHIIDPRSGRPVDHAEVAVTVLHDSATHADAYATGLLVMGEDAAEFASRHDLKVMLVRRTDDGFKGWRSTAMKGYLAETID